MRIHSIKNNGEENGQAVASSANKPSRRSFLRKSAIGTAVAVPVIAVAGTAAHMLTSTTSASAASASAALLTLTPSQAFHEIMRDENAHVAFLQDALGAAARPKPTFNNNIYSAGLRDFKEVAASFEVTGVGAYLMAAPAIANKDYLAAAGSILTIEARHSGYLNSLIGAQLSTSGSFDQPFSQSSIVQAVSPFIESLNGGPDPSAPLTSDVDILNFALLLEFLESAFYNLNVPRYY